MEQNNIVEFKLIHDDACEDSVLATILNIKNAINECRDILDESCFFSSKNKIIFNAIKEIDRRGEVPTILNITPIVLENGKKERITVSDILVLADNTILYDFYNYTLRLSILAEKRKVYELGYNLMLSCSNEAEELTDIVSNARKDLDSLQDKKQDQFITIDKSLEDVNAIVSNNISGESSTIGTHTGFEKLDEHGGFHDGDLVIIAAETSQGKTSFALSITKNILDNGGKIAFYSMEMQHYKLTARLVSMESTVSSSSILYNKLNNDELKKFDTAVNNLMDKNLYYDDRSTSNIDVILASIRNMKVKYDIDGAVIDYLQILSINRGNRNSTDEQLMGEIARRLKNLAKELGIWIVALSQLSRNQDNPVPTMSRLRSSGQIAEAADMVILIYRPECYQKRYPEPYTNSSTDGTAMISIVKARDTGRDDFLCAFNARNTHFYDDFNIGTYSAKSSEDAPF